MPSHVRLLSLVIALLGAGCGAPPAAPASAQADVPVPSDSLLREALAEVRTAATAYEALFNPPGDSTPLPDSVPAARFDLARDAGVRAARAAARADSLLLAVAARTPLGQAALEIRAALDISPGLADDLLHVGEDNPLPAWFDPRPLQAQFDDFAGYLRRLAAEAAAEAD